MKGKTILEDSKALGSTVETAVFSHLATHSVTNNGRFSYWKDSKDRELDLVLEVADELIPFEVKYQSSNTELKDVQGLVNFCDKKSFIKHGYVLTKSHHDIGLLENNNLAAKIIKIPASIFCYWLGESEILRKSILTKSF